MEECKEDVVTSVQNQDLEKVMAVLFDVEQVKGIDSTEKMYEKTRVKIAEMETKLTEKLNEKKEEFYETDDTGGDVKRFKKNDWWEKLVPDEKVSEDCPFKQLVKGHNSLEESLTTAPMTFRYDESLVLRYAGSWSSRKLEFFKRSDRDFKAYKRIWSAIGKPDPFQNCVTCGRSPETTHFGGEGRLHSFGNIQEVFKQFFERDCAGLPTVPYKVSFVDGAFTIDVPFFYLLSNQSREHLNYAIQNFVWWLRVGYDHFGEGFYGDKIRSWLYANFYTAMTHPASWLDTEKQWWYKRLNGVAASN